MDELVNPIIIVRRNGLMTELHAEMDGHPELRICRTHLVCARPYIERLNSYATISRHRVITSSKSGCVHIATETESGWVSEEIPCDHERDSEVLSVVPLPVLGSFLAIRTHTVELIDITNYRVIHTFHTESIKPDTLRCFHSARRRPQCGSVGLAHFALAYTSTDSGQCIMHFYQPKHEGDTICFRDPFTPGSKTCCLWTETVEQKHHVDNPGHWEALSSGHLIGVRKYETTLKPIETPGRTNFGSGLRKRGGFDRKDAYSASQAADDKWEVWSISGRGDVTTAPLSGIQNDHLLVETLGPFEKLGKRTLAVGLGNVIKIITVGKEKFDSMDSASDDAAFVGMTASRRKKSSSGRKRTS
jgi:hypothetical protein